MNLSPSFQHKFIGTLLLMGWCLRLCVAGPVSLEAITLVAAGEGVGSGFILEENGTFYMVTNVHVIEGGVPIRAQTFSGKKVPLGKLEVANTRDVARFEIPDYSGEAFNASSQVPSIGSTIVIYGNSDGSGVATELKGNVLGVGPELLEVDAKFVQGNSGSPILNDTGEVVGVATFAVKVQEKANWLKKDSRFNNIRRYGVRMEGVEWIEMDLRGFVQRAALLADLSHMAEQLYLITYTDTYHDAAGTRIKYPMERDRKSYRKYSSFAKDLNNYTTALNGAWTWIQGIYQSANQHNRTRSSSQRRDALQDFKMSQMMSQQKIDAFKLQANQLKASVHRRLAHDQWGSEYFLEKAKELYGVFDQLLTLEEQ